MLEFLQHERDAELGKEEGGLAKPRFVLGLTTNLVEQKSLIGDMFSSKGKTFGGKFFLAERRSAKLHVL